MGIIVQKFGGTSVADSEKIKNVASAALREKNKGNQVVVVVSAQGDTTDDLIEKAVEIMSVNPAKRFGLDIEVAEGKKANFAVFDIEQEYEIDAENFVSMGKSMPFNGEKVYGQCLYNFNQGKLVYKK